MSFVKKGSLKEYIKFNTMESINKMSFVSTSASILKKRSKEKRLKMIPKAICLRTVSDVLSSFLTVL